MDHDTRWGHGRERDGAGPEREVGGRGGSAGPRPRDEDPRDVFRRDLDLPDTRERVRVQLRDRSYGLNDEDVRALSTIGAFRVVAEDDLARRASDTTPSLDDEGRIDRLSEAGLVETVAIDGGDQRAVALTREGRELLEASRLDRDGEPRQAFHARLCRPRELSHDMQVYRAYQREAGDIHAEGGRVVRVVLDHELKREYQQFLQEPNRGYAHSDGRPGRSRDEAHEWADQHDLPWFDDQAHFPDCRIEYEDRYGRDQHRDVEITTPHYRGAHAAATARAGFACHRGAGISGRHAGSRSGNGPRGGLAEELLR
jgi:DNA-binding MarR family transcriptional regulator